jgi:uncharacterized protein YecE (DUF72 family)
MGAEPIVRVIAGDDVDTALDGLLAWTDQVVDWLTDGKRPYVFAHQPENGDSPSLARRFHAAVAERLATLVALPAPVVFDAAGGPEDQAALF